MTISGDSDHNDIWPEFVGQNGGLPIDLGGDGHTPNDPSDHDLGPNGLLNYPEITSVAGNVVQGTACSGCIVRIYAALGDPSAPGGGGSFVRSVTADTSGNWSADLTGDGLTPADISLVAVATFHGETASEMSPRIGFQVFLPIVARH